MKFVKLSDRKEEVYINVDGIECMTPNFPGDGAGTTLHMRSGADHYVDQTVEQILNSPLWRHYDIS